MNLGFSGWQLPRRAIKDPESPQVRGWKTRRAKVMERISRAECVRCGQPVEGPHSVDCPFRERDPVDRAVDLIGAGMSVGEAMSSSGMEVPSVEVSDSVKLARYFLGPIERASGPDYAIAFCRIVDWFDGRCSCQNRLASGGEHQPECTMRIKVQVAR